MPVELLAAANMLTNQPTDAALDAHCQMQAPVAALREYTERAKPIVDHIPGLNIAPSGSPDIEIRPPQVTHFSISNERPLGLPFDISQNRDAMTHAAVNGQMLFNTGVASHSTLLATQGDMFIKAGSYQCLENPAALPLALEGEVGFVHEIGTFRTGKLIGKTSLSQTICPNPLTSNLSGNAVNAGIEYQTDKAVLGIGVSSIFQTECKEASQVVRLHGHQKIVSDIPLNCGLTLNSSIGFSAAFGPEGVSARPQLQMEASTPDHKLALRLNCGVQFGSSESKSGPQAGAQEGHFVTMSLVAKF